MSEKSVIETSLRSVVTALFLGSHGGLPLRFAIARWRSLYDAVGKNSRVRSISSDGAVGLKHSHLFANMGSRERCSLVGRGVTPHKNPPTA